MQPRRITAYTDLRGREVTDLRTVGNVPSTTPNEPPSASITQAHNTTNPSEEAKLQREASLTSKPNLVTQTETDAERAQRLIKVHPDDLPCGYLEATSLSKGELTTKGNIVVIITGPFGGGKDTIAKALLTDKSLNTTKAVLYTSRPMGNKEVNGADYYFVSKEQFTQMIEGNEFLSWNDLEPGFYGVHLNSTKALLSTGKDIVAAVGPTVAKPLKKGLGIANIPFVEVFVLPVPEELLREPNGIDKAIEILKARIRDRNRGKTDETMLELLMQRSKTWFGELDRFQHVVENLDGKLDLATSNVKNLIHAKKAEVLSSLEDSELAKLSPQLRFLETGETPDVSLNTEGFKKNQNVVVILTGPSGAGKGTILDSIARDGLLHITEALSHTTRPVGKNEANGKDYHFVSRQEFIQMIAEGDLLEWVMVHNGYFFGKSLSNIQENFRGGNDVVLSLNISGANFYKHLLTKLGIPYVDIFLSPAPKDLLNSQQGIDEAIDILRKRITDRNRGETTKQIEERLAIAREWLSEAHKYSHVVENTDGQLEQAVNSFAEIVQAKRREAYASDAELSP